MPRDYERDVLADAKTMGENRAHYVAVPGVVLDPAVADFVSSLVRRIDNRSESGPALTGASVYTSCRGRMVRVTVQEVPEAPAQRTPLSPLEYIRLAREGGHDSLGLAQQEADLAAEIKALPKVRDRSEAGGGSGWGKLAEVTEALRVALGWGEGLDFNPTAAVATLCAAQRERFATVCERYAEVIESEEPDPSTPYVNQARMDRAQGARRCAAMIRACGPKLGDEETKT